MGDFFFCLLNSKENILWNAHLAAKTKVTLASFPIGVQLEIENVFLILDTTIRILK